jgi:2'-5' RNA ligase
VRLFIAIELPENVKRLLYKLRTDIQGARWLPMEQLHLTLSFLGEVDEETAKKLIRDLSAIKAPAFDLRFCNPGCFPNRRQARVLWVGLEPEPLLSNLASLVQKTVLSCNIPQEERPFSAHVTLARLKAPGSREVAAFLDQPQRHKIPPVSVREFILFQSRLTPNGAVHTPLKNFTLLNTAR